MLVERIRVSTPQGDRYHGDIVLNEKKQAIFVRVLQKKDKMRMFDAWSLHPDALKKFDFWNVIGLYYKTPNGNLKLKLEDLKKMLSGEIRSGGGNKLAWEKEFSGGMTIYIKEEAFEKIK